MFVRKDDDESAMTKLASEHEGNNADPEEIPDPEEIGEEIEVRKQHNEALVRNPPVIQFRRVTKSARNGASPQSWDLAVEPDLKNGSRIQDLRLNVRGCEMLLTDTMSAPPVRLHVKHHHVVEAAWVMRETFEPFAVSVSRAGLRTADRSGAM